MWQAVTNIFFFKHSGVAIGSSIGHVVGNGISSLFGGGSSEPTQATQAQAAPQTNNSTWGNNCAGATEQFTKCMDEHGGNMSICGWYLEQLVCVSLFFIPLFEEHEPGDGGFDFREDSNADDCPLYRKRARLRRSSSKLVGGGTRRMYFYAKSQHHGQWRHET